MTSSTPDVHGGVTAGPASEAAGAAAVPAADEAVAEEEIQTLLLPDIPPLTLVVPESFHALPLAATAEERAALAEEFVRELYPNGSEQLWSPAAPYYASLGEAMDAQGLAYAAMGLFGIDNGIAHCSFTVAAVESDHPSVEVAANGIRVILAADETNDVRWIDLPCGPAIACITLREYVIGAELNATGEEVRLRMGQIQVYVPFPTGPFTAVFTLDTPAVDHWGEFCEMTMAVLRSVAFPAPSDEPDGEPVSGPEPAPAIR